MELATIATPNLPELRRLTSEEDPVAAARAIEAGLFVVAAAQSGRHEDGRCLVPHRWGAPCRVR